MSSSEINGGLLSKIVKEQINASARSRRAFVLGVGLGKGLSEFDEILLPRLAIASPARPVSTPELTAHMLANFYGGRVEPDFARRQVLQEISYLNRRKLPIGIGLRIHNIAAPRTEGQYFNGGADRWLFPPEAKAMDLLAAGYSEGEVVEMTEYRDLPALKKKLVGVYSWLGVRGVLGAALFLCQHGQIDLEPLLRRVNIGGFSSLPDRLTQVLDSLIGNGGRINKEIASDLGLEVSGVKYALSTVNTHLGVSGLVSRVALGVGYWLFRQEPDRYLPVLSVVPESKEPLNRLNSTQVEILRLKALGLTTKEIGVKLAMAVSTTKSIATQIYEKLGVRGGLQAVLKSIECGLLDLDDLIGDDSLSEFESLRPGEKRIMDGLVSGNGEYGLDNSTLAGYLGLKVSTINNNMSRIGSVALNESNSKISKIRLAVLYLAYKRRSS